MYDISVNHNQLLNVTKDCLFTCNIASFYGSDALSRNVGLALEPCSSDTDASHFAGYN